MDPKRLDHFKERFVDALKVAIAVYRDATWRSTRTVSPPHQVQSLFFV